MATGVLKTPRLIQALENIDRADFVPLALKAEAYVNEPLPIGHAQTISQPLTVAFMLEQLQPGPGDKVLDIGSGSGWQTALLSYIVSHDEFNYELPTERRGHVVGLELIPELADWGRANLGQYSFIRKHIAEIHCRNGAKGYAEAAPYDRIIAAAGSEIPATWKEQLKIGGKIVAPIESKIVCLTKISDQEFEEKDYEGFAFVPFVA